MNCSELVGLVTDYLEGSMHADERARFDEHVSGCDGCTTYLEQFRITIRLTGMLSEDQVAPRRPRSPPRRVPRLAGVLLALTPAKS